MPNTKQPCWCKRCRGLVLHYHDARKRHRELYGIHLQPAIIPPSITPIQLLENMVLPFLTLLDRFSPTDCVLQDIDQLQGEIPDENIQHIPTSTIVTTPTPSLVGTSQVSVPSASPPLPHALTSREKLAEVCLRNKGRPLGNRLIDEILRSIYDGFDKGHMPRTSRSLLKAVPSSQLKYVRVCSVCYLHLFEAPSICNSVTCKTCGILVFLCQNPSCKARVNDGVGTQPVRAQKECCGVGPTTPTTIQSYQVLTFTEIVTTLISQREQALELLKPFDSVVTVNGKHIQTIITFYI